MNSRWSCDPELTWPDKSTRGLAPWRRFAITPGVVAQRLWILLLWPYSLPINALVEWRAIPAMQAIPVGELPVVWQNRYMKRPFSATVWREGDWFVSQCLDVDIASQGNTEEEALANLREALELHFEPPIATHPRLSAKSR